MFATILHGALKVTVEVSVTAAADNILRFKKNFLGKIRLDISCELSPRQMID